MKRILIGGLAAATILTGAFPAVSAGNPDPRSFEPFAPLRIQAESERGALRKLSAYSFAKVGAPKGVIGNLMRGGSRSPGFYMYPAGDLDDDGKRDLLGLSYEEDRDSYSTTVAAIRGRDGSVLWKNTYQNTYAYAIPARVGPDADPGALLLINSALGQDAVAGGAWVIDQEITALSGDGETVWSRTYRGLVLYSYAAYLGYDLAYPMAVFDAVKGDALDIMVGHDTFMYHSLGWESDMEAEVLDGRDGSSMHRSSSDREGRYSWPFPVSDLSGDGLDDYVFLTWRGGKGVWFSARNGRTGSELWGVDSGIRRLGAVESVGDADGDGTGDLLISATCADCAIYAAMEPRMSRYVYRTGPVALLSGQDGTANWKKTAGLATRAGDVDGDGNPDVAIQTVLRRGDSLGVRYEALNEKGNTLFEKSYTMNVETDNAIGYLKAIPDAGDVNSDGVQDALHSFVFADFNKERFFSDRGMVNGRDGDKMWVGEPGIPLHVSLDGNGSDLYEISSSGKNALSLVTQDGRDGHPLWSSQVGMKARRWMFPLTIDVTGDGTHDILLNSYQREGRQFRYLSAIVDGADGSVVWSRL